MTDPADKLDHAILAYASAHQRYDPASVDPDCQDTPHYIAAHSDTSKRQVTTDPAKEKAWTMAMLAYSHARFDLGLTRLEASKIFEPMLSDPYHQTPARLMLDIAKRFPE